MNKNLHLHKQLLNGKRKKKVSIFGSISIPQIRKKILLLKKKKNSVLELPDDKESAKVI